MSDKTLMELLEAYLETERAPLRRKRRKLMGALCVGVACDVGVVVLAWSMWGWRGATLFFCVALSNHASKYARSAR